MREKWISIKEEDEKNKVGWRSEAIIRLGVQKHSLNVKLHNKVQGLGYGAKQGFYLHHCTQKLLSHKPYWMGIRTGYFVAQRLTERK